MDQLPSERDHIPFDLLKKLFEQLDADEYVGNLQISFHYKPVRVQLHRHMKRKELERFLTRDRPAK